MQEEGGSCPFPLIELTVDCSNWLCSGSFQNQSQIKSKFSFLLSTIADYLALEGTLHVSVLLTNDKKLKELNKEYLGKDKPTNVLSFPANSALRDAMGKMFLGDIAMSYDRVNEESIEFLRSFEEHFSHMVIHAVLHLLGYDHQTDDDAYVMEGIESCIMTKLGFKPPYADSKESNILPNIGMESLVA